MTTTQKRWTGWAGLLAGLGLVAAMVVLMGATNITGGRCSTILLTSGYDEYFAVGSRNTRRLDISFDRDQLGVATVQTLTLQYCSLQTSASCADYDFDTTGDSLGNTNVLLDNDVTLAGHLFRQEKRLRKAIDPIGVDAVGRSGQ